MDIGPGARFVNAVLVIAVIVLVLLGFVLGRLF